jgi:sugar-specific transcriptional regulator TrmB
MGKEIEKLERLGFSNYEARVFFALYQGSVMSAADAAKEARIPRPSVYEILKNFCKKGICNEIHTPTKQLYEIIDSDILETKIENEIRKETSLKLSLIKSTFKEIKPLHRSKRPAEFQSDVELIKGFNRSREMKFQDLIRKSKKAILYMNRFEGNVSDGLDSETKNFYKRGGKFRSIYEASGNFKIKINNQWQVISKDELIELCKKFEKQGEKIKLSENIPQILAVFDGKTVFISLYDENVPKNERSDIIIHNKRFAGFVTEMFELYWDKSESIEKFAKTLISN